MFFSSMFYVSYDDAFLFDMYACLLQELCIMSSLGMFRKLLKMFNSEFYFDQNRFC